MSTITSKSDTARPPLDVRARSRWYMRTYEEPGETEEADRSEVCMGRIRSRQDCWGWQAARGIRSQTLLRWLDLDLIDIRRDRFPQLLSDAASLAEDAEDIPAEDLVDVGLGVAPTQ
jgi:hypothetical protein